MPVEDIYADQEDVVTTKYYEFNGKAFKINQEGPYSHWTVRHATGQVVKVIEGTFTNFDAAVRAIHQLPDEYFEKIPKKTVLTPKGSVSSKHDTQENNITRSSE